MAAVSLVVGSRLNSLIWYPRLVSAPRLRASSPRLSLPADIHDEGSVVHCQHAAGCYTAAWFPCELNALGDFNSIQTYKVPKTLAWGAQAC